MSKKKKTVIILAAIVCVIGVALGLKIPVNLQNDKIEQAIEEFIVNERESAENHISENEKWFVSTKIYRTDKNISGHITVYAWILAESYYMENGEIKEGSGFSIPHIFNLNKTEHGYKVLNYQIPGDGSNYAKDMRRMFPLDVYYKMSNVQYDGTIKNLMAENKNNAEKYFKEN